jgi:hypothetical protein
MAPWTEHMMLAGVFLLVGCAGFMALAARGKPQWRRFQILVGLVAIALATIVLVLEYVG